MNFTQFASGRSTLPFTTANVNLTNDGNLNVNSVVYFSIQGQNRVGLSRNSSLIAKSITSISKVTITLPTILPGEDWINIIVSASTTNDPTTLTQIVSIPRKDVTAPVVLESPEILKLTTSDRTVADPTALPNPSINGLCCYVTSLNYYYVYDQYSTSTINNTTVLSSTIGRWLQLGSINTYQSDTQGSGGCDQDVRTPNLKVVTQSYAVDGSKGAGTTFWIRNDNTDVIKSGTRVSCVVRLYEEDRSQLFDSLLILESAGYIDLTTGVLDVSTAIGEIPYQPKTQYLTLPEDLPQGSAMVVTVSPKFRPEHLDNQVPYLANLTTYLTFAPTTGIYAPGVFGNLIYVNDQRWRITPGIGVSVIKGKGSGLILKQELNDISKETINLTSNVANQYIFLTSNGTSFSSTTTSFVSAVKRAVVSTVNGEGTASNYGSVTLDNTKQLSVTVNYSNLIRNDYPDTLIAGGISNNNASSVVIYIKDSANNYFKYQYAITPDATTETKVLDFGDFTSTTGLPTVDTNFGLFKPSSVVTTSSINTSIFNSDTYIVYVSYKYNGVVTSIDHSVSELVEANSDVSILFNGAYSQWFTGIGVPSSTLGKNNDYYLITTTKEVYYKSLNIWNYTFSITGVNSFTFSTSSYIQPEVNSTITISVLNSSWMSVGQPLYISNGGTYTIVSINSINSISIKNVGYNSNTTVNTTISTNQKISPGGLGDSGNNSSFDKILVDTNGSILVNSNGNIVNI